MSITPRDRGYRLVSKEYEAAALARARRQQRRENVLVSAILLLFAACVVGVVGLVVWGMT